MMIKNDNKFLIVLIKIEIEAIQDDFMNVARTQNRGKSSKTAVFLKRFTEFKKASTFYIISKLLVPKSSTMAGNHLFSRKSNRVDEFECNRINRC